MILVMARASHGTGSKLKIQLAHHHSTSCAPISFLDSDVVEVYIFQSQELRSDQDVGKTYDSDSLILVTFT